MEITAWKLVAYDEDNNEFVVDVDNHVANIIDNFLTEECEGVSNGTI